ncbi:MAG: glycoside hydrolase family 3 C-terminal domain-containing protein [Enterobacter sp.]
MGLFNDPYSHLGPKESDPVDTNAESRLHRKEAREVARESLVLLKNRLETLPLKKSATIAVVGPLADSKRDVMGSWSAAGVADQSVTVLTGIKSAVGDNGKVAVRQRRERHQTTKASSTFLEPVRGSGEGGSAHAERDDRRSGERREAVRRGGRCGG